MTTPLVAARAMRRELIAARRSRWARDQTGYRYVRDTCESPIEHAFALALFQVPEVRGRTLDRLVQVLRSRSRTAIFVFGQCPVGNYRVDFLLIGKNVPRPRALVVECDGAQYHDRARDAVRDHELQEMGLSIVRFPGGEIFDDPGSVIDQTLAQFGLPSAACYTWSMYRAIVELRKRIGGYQVAPPLLPTLPILDDMLAAFRRRAA